MIGTKLTRYFKELTLQNPDSIVSSAHSLMKLCENNKEYFMVFVNWVMTTYEPGKATLMDAESVFLKWHFLILHMIKLSGLIQQKSILSVREPLKCRLVS